MTFFHKVWSLIRPPSNHIAPHGSYPRGSANLANRALNRVKRVFASTKRDDSSDALVAIVNKDEIDPNREELSILVQGLIDRALDERLGPLPNSAVSLPRLPDSYEFEIPFDEFVHLKELATARGQSLNETLRFLLRSDFQGEAGSLDGRYSHEKRDDETITITPDVAAFSHLIRSAINGLPRWIKSATDRPLTSDISFDETNEGVKSITIDGRKFYDSTPIGERERQVFKALRDRLPAGMTLEDFRIMSFCQSQYKIMLHQPERYVMPDKKGMTCIDAGSFVGYRAMAMADIVGPTGRVLAIELDERSNALQEMCFAENGVQNYVKAICCALSNKPEWVSSYNNNPGSMANSLVKIDQFGSTLSTKDVQTKRLDSILLEEGIDYVDHLHVSVNGFEPEVLGGLGDYVGRIGVFCVMTPYSIGNNSVRERVIDFFKEHDIYIHGLSQAAVVAGPRSHHYPVGPM